MTKLQYWSEAERARLLQLRDQEHLAWDEIAAHMAPRSEIACRAQYYQALTLRNAAKSYLPCQPQEIAHLKIAAAPVRHIAPPAIAICQAPPSSPGRRVSRAALCEHAELRARLDHPHGLTAGLFGDPLPGRSALDRKA